MEEFKSEQQLVMEHLTLVKGCHKFVIGYEPGSEGMVLDHLVMMVHNVNLPFDWFDAAVLSGELNRRLAKQLKEFIK